MKLDECRRSSTQKLIDDSASPLSQSLIRDGGLNEAAGAAAATAVAVE